MPLFAIQWALIVCNILSSITALPGVLYAVDSDQFHAAMERFFDKMPNPSDQKLLKLMMKFLFGGLLFVYILGIFAGFYCPTPVIGYMFGAGNFLRVGYIGLWMMNAETYAMTGFGGQLKVILVVQSVLGIVILACTYISSGNADYQAYAAAMAADAEGKWDADAFYIKFIFGIHAFFTLTGLPGLIAPGFAIKQYITVESKLPADKAGMLTLEFLMGFQQLAILTIQIFGAVMLWYAPSIDVIALYWQPTGIFFIITIFCYNILNADAYGFDRTPMLVFFFLNAFTMGVSFMALMA